MTIKLNRSKIFLIGIGIIILYLFLNRIDYIFGSSTAAGQVVKTKQWSTYSRSPGSYSAPIIKFNTGSDEITFQGVTNMDVSTGDKVEVIYKTADPANAEVYSFVGFWLSPLLYCIIPFLILTAVVFSFLTQFEYLNITLGKKIKVSKTIEHRIDIGRQGNKKLPPIEYTAPPRHNNLSPIKKYCPPLFYFF